MKLFASEGITMEYGDTLFPTARYSACSLKQVVTDIFFCDTPFLLLQPFWQQITEQSNGLQVQFSNLSCKKTLHF